ncbi:MAG: hypothetical protein NZ929_02270 [Aigarchaeota archaeon]|nr:hypothetical protein [Aigarchaeota archaeon]MCX8192973.1 hypothetical protein [Nitrososphaeria archaeon]MDW7986291.1 hypothetical protein [Nitrososphaerota archaeon]
MGGAKIKVIIKTAESEVEFEGEYQDVWISINKYLSEIYPSLEVVKKLVGAVDVKELAEKLVGKVELKENRINITAAVDAKKKIILCLAGAYVGKILGIFDKDFLTPKEIANYTGLDEKIVRARLSELRRDGLTIRKEDGLYGFTSASLKEIVE